MSLIKTWTVGNSQPEEVWINPAHIMKAHPNKFTDARGEKARGSDILFVSGHSLSIALPPEAITTNPQPQGR